MRLRPPELRSGEAPALGLSFLLFFSLLLGYGILRPLRDAMAVAGGTRSLSQALLFTWTFGAMLVAVPVYSALVARLPRQRLLPGLYRCFLLQLLGFYVLFQAGVAPVGVARAFFVWVSVYNLFVVSVFWSFMADVFSREQGQRLFGAIAAGGTAGTLAGLALTGLLASQLGPARLLLVTALLLEVSARCVRQLAQWAHRRQQAAPGQPGPEAPVGGGAFSAFGLLLHSPFLLALGAQTLLYAATSTFLYFHQQRLVAAATADTGERIALFAWMDLGVQGLTLLLQLFATGPLLQRLGLAAALALVPLLTGLGFLGLALAPTLGVVAVVRALRSASHYAFERPGRELLFTGVDREERYKAKSVIDTAVYRGSDLVSSWLYAGVGALGLGLAGTALAALPLAAAWGAVALYLARRHEASGGLTHSPPVPLPAGTRGS